MWRGSIRLAESPEIIQQAVTPGLLTELTVALKGNWTRAKLEAEVKRPTGAVAGTETQPGAERETTGVAEREPEGPKRLLFRNRAGQWVLHPAQHRASPAR